MKSRKEEITDTYFRLMREHLEDVKAGRSKVLGLKDISARMHMQERHLSNTVKAVTGKSPCSFFEEELIYVAKELLSSDRYKISEVAMRLDYDPSNFTKFFKHYTGQTPSQYQQSFAKN